MHKYNKMLTSILSPINVDDVIIKDPNKEK